MILARGIAGFSSRHARQLGRMTRDQSEAVMAAGIRIAERPVDFGTAVRAFFVRDPDGNIVGLTRRGASAAEWITARALSQL
ncbi:MAG: hypothetical protein DRJ42_02580 [Deltaproteobacteria bacterium]|nr:MAG: hypothetical protein DRJ42_02580 [Deltaproteobacteria bacterium]